MTRHYGDGTVKRQPDGRWYGQVNLGTDEHGKRRRKTFRATTENEVRKQMRAARAAYEKGEHVVTNESTRWGPWCDTYTDHLDARVATGQIARSTAEWTVAMLAHGRRLLGENRRLVDLRPVHVEQMTAALAREGKAPGTIRAVHGAVRGALALAVRDGLLVRNVAEQVPRVRSDHREAAHVTPDQFRALLAATDDSTRLPVLLMGVLGLRKGEVLALAWADVDLDAGLLHVRHSLGRTKADGLVRGPTKSRASRRTIALPASVVAALRPARGLPAAPVCPCPTTGTWWEPRGFARAFARVATAAGHPDVHPHSLRHGAATQAVASGVPLPAVRDMLGHSSVRVTGDTYAHVLADQRDAVSEAVAGAMLGT
jgi:integrase